MRGAALLLAAVALAGCGGHTARTPEQVARAWSAALDRNDNEAAGSLFARDAQIVQSVPMVLHGHRAAVGWNAALPCGGRILSVQKRSEAEVLVVFRLTERPEHACDAPDQEAAAVFEVHDGKIVLWHQVPVPTPGQSV